MLAAPRSHTYNTKLTHPKQEKARYSQSTAHCVHFLLSSSIFLETPSHVNFPCASPVFPLSYTSLFLASLTHTKKHTHTQLHSCSLSISLSHARERTFSLIRALTHSRHSPLNQALLNIMMNAKGLELGISLFLFPLLFHVCSDLILEEPYSNNAVVENVLRFQKSLTFTMGSVNLNVFFATETTS